jgi:hypothetical protein
VKNSPSKIFEGFLGMASVKWVMMLSMSVVSLVYLSVGFYILALKGNKIFQPGVVAAAPACPGDFYLRWIEGKAFAEGINPYDIFDPEGLSGKAESYQRKVAEFYDRNPRPKDGSGYPPWAFPVFYLLFAPFLEIEQSRIFYGIVNAGVLFFMVFSLFRRLRSILTARDSALVCASAFSLNAWYITLHNGQLSLILSAAVLASTFPWKRGWGDFFSNSMLALKPTFGAYVLMVNFIKRPWRLMVAGSFVLCVWLLSSFHSGEAPIRQLGQMFLVTSSGGNSLVDLSWFDAYPSKVVFKVGFALGLLLTIGAMFRLSADGRFLQVAVSLLLMRLFCYHRDYDNCMVFMAIICMGVYALKSGHAIPTFLWLVHVLIFSIPSSLYGAGSFFIYNSGFVAACCSLFYLSSRYPGYLWQLDSSGPDRIPEPGDSVSA